MALFSRKTKSEVGPASGGKEKSVILTVGGAQELSHILKRPRITEKASMANAAGVYVFDVSPKANKREIAQAVARYYKVVPRMVRVVSIPEKSVRSMKTGARGVKQGGKKAYVYLKRGETITVA